MAQPVKSGEPVRKKGGKSARSAVTDGVEPELLRAPRAARAVVALGEAAARSTEDSAMVVQLLEAVARVARTSIRPGTVPAGERELWESVGAGFDDRPALSRGQARSATAFAELLSRSAAGDADAAHLLGGRDRTRISQKVSERSLFAVPSGTERYYPAWQFVDGKPLRGLKAVLGALDPQLHPLSVDHWFTTPNLDLEVSGEALTPVEWLSTGGDITIVARLASHV